MKGTARALAALAPIGLLAVLAHAQNPQLPAPVRFPRILFVGDQGFPVAALPLAAAPAALGRIYQVKLDRRFVGAVGEMHQIATGQPAGTVMAVRTEAGWALNYQDNAVGVVPDMPGYRDVERALGAWGTRLLGQTPLPAGGAPVDAAVDQQLGQVAVPAVARGLQAVGHRWAARHDPYLLALAGRGLTMLLLGVPRQSELIDPLAARAVAVVTLAAAAGRDVTRERVLLANRMGYTGDARAISATLPAQDPVRLFAAGDTSGLRLAAERADASPLVRFLYLLKLVDADEPAAWRRWQRAQSFEPEFHSGVLGAALDFNEFNVDRVLAPLMAQQLYLEAADLAGRGLLAGSPPRVHGMFSSAGDTATAWNGILENPGSAGRGWLLGQFEADVEQVAREFNGPFLDRQALALVFRAQLHAAFEHGCLHDVRGLASRGIAQRFAGAFADAPDGLWSESARWCEHRSGVLAGRDSLPLLVADLGTTSGISDYALTGTHQAIQDALRYSDTSDVRYAQRYLARLDSRPSGLDRAGDVAGDVLYDAPLRERFYQRVVDLAPADHSFLRVWWARYHEDGPTLARQAVDPTLDRSSRLVAIRALQRTRGDSASARAAFASLIAQDPHNWDIRSDLVELLEKSRRFDEAAQVAKQWLDAHPATYGFDRTFATTALARQYQRLGRPQEGWDLLKTLIETGQLGVLQRSALIARDLGKTQVAESLATAVVRRYPDSPHSRVTLAEIMWSLGRNGEAAAALHDRKYPLSISEWRDPVGPIFVGFFGRKALAEAQAAFAALVTSGVSPNLLSAIPESARDSSRFELAVTLREQLPPDADQRVTAWLETYRFLRNWKGETEARTWLRQRWPAEVPRGPALEFYRAGEFDLLWTMTTNPDQGNEGSYLWVLRALASRQVPVTPGEERELMDHFRSPSTAFYDLAGRVVLGLEPEAALLAQATDSHRRCEVSYYAGVRALGEHRYADASNWFRVTVETPSKRDWEWLFAKDALYTWAAKNRDLPIAIRESAKKK